MCYVGVKALCTYLTALSVLSVCALAEVVPYELAWIVIPATVPNTLRKLFKLNTRAVALILQELDFWIPFVTGCLASYFASASFDHDGPAASNFICVFFAYTVEVLMCKYRASRLAPCASRLAPRASCPLHHISYKCLAQGLKPPRRIRTIIKTQRTVHAADLHTTIHKHRSQPTPTCRRARSRARGRGLRIKSASSYC